MDDVLIGFEKLRRHVRYELVLSNVEVLSMKSLIDIEAIKFFNVTGTSDRRTCTESYEPWTESDVTINLKTTVDDCPFKKNVPTTSCRQPSDFSIVTEADNNNDDCGKTLAAGENKKEGADAETVASDQDDFKDAVQYPDKQDNVKFVFERNSSFSDSDDEIDEIEFLINDNLPSNNSQDSDGVQITFQKSPDRFSELSSTTKLIKTNRKNAKSPSSNSESNNQFYSISNSSSISLNSKDKESQTAQQNTKTDSSSEKSEIYETVVLCQKENSEVGFFLLNF